MFPHREKDQYRYKHHQRRSEDQDEGQKFLEGALLGRLRGGGGLRQNPA